MPDPTCCLYSFQSLQKSSLGIDALFLSPCPSTPNVPLPKVKSCPAEVTSTVYQGPQDSIRRGGH